MNDECLEILFKIAVGLTWVFIMIQIDHFTDSVRAIAKKMKDHRDDKTDLDL